MAADAKDQADNNAINDTPEIHLGHQITIL